jgi:hypothetical protein
MRTFTDERTLRARSIMRDEKGSVVAHTDDEIVGWVIRRWTRMGGSPRDLDDIAVGSLMAAKLVLRFAFVAGLDFDANPEALASMEKMSDETALEHLPSSSGAARRRWGAALPDLPHLKRTDCGWRWTARAAESAAAGAVGPMARPSEGAERLFGDIMAFLGRSRVILSDGGGQEAQECFAQILAMMAVPKVVFALLGDDAAASAVESLADRLADQRYLESTGPLQ